MLVRLLFPPAYSVSLFSKALHILFAALFVDRFAAFAPCFYEKIPCQFLCHKPIIYDVLAVYRGAGDNYLLAS